MIHKFKLPTILGLLVLVVGLIAGIILIKNTKFLGSSADVAAVPKNVRVTNITDSSVTVTWTTDIKSSGIISWGTTKNSLSKVSSEDETDKNFVHSIDLVGIAAGSDLYIKINSNGTDYDNNGTPWQTKTNLSTTISQNKQIASGLVLQNDAATPAKVLVYLTINGKSLSKITSDEGSYVIPISSYMDKVEDSVVIEISAIDGNENTAQGVIYPTVIKSTPTMILGKTYDFRSLTVENDLTTPQSSLTIPQSVEISSRFEVTKVDTITTSGNVNLDSIKEGEIINTTDPEFFGTAPKSSGIEIKVESELQTGTITVGANGKWKWSPPNNLEPGEHKVTLSWRDASGVLRTLTRTFIVQASEGPAFVSTPSASLSPTTVPTVSPTLTPTINPIATTISTPVSTLPPTPETGSLTPTIGLFIMGIGVLMSSFFVYKKQDA